MKKKSTLKQNSNPVKENKTAAKTETRSGVSSKGFYRHPQPDKYVALRQYLFLRSGGEKYLLLRFENNTESTVDGLEILVTEMNIDGKVIGTRRATSGKLSASPGAVFSVPKKIRISKDCVDFKIKVVKATSGSYVYSANSNYVRVHYEKPTSRRRSSYTSVYTKKSSLPTKFSKAGVFLTLITILTVGVALGYSILTYFTDFRLEKIPEYIGNFLGWLFDTIFSFGGDSEI